MWHELVLHGIGGNTIEQAKNHLSYAEFQQWAEYIRTKGSLNAALRVDRVLSQIAAVFGRAFLKFSDGSKCSPENFTPWPKEDDPVFGTPESVLGLLKSISTPEK